MLNKEQFLTSVQHEINIIKHLAGKLTAENLEYRPSEPQRSMLQLLQYLTVCGSGPAINCISGDWDHMEAMGEEAKKVTLETFAQAMDDQMDVIIGSIEDKTDEELIDLDAQTPWGAPIKAGPALLDMTLKCLVAYRMQLFLYAKAAGHSTLGPANCWAGVDWSPEE